MRSGCITIALMQLSGLGSMPIPPKARIAQPGILQGYVTVVC